MVLGWSGLVVVWAGAREGSVALWSALVVFRVGGHERVLWRWAPVVWLCYGRGREGKPTTLGSPQCGKRGPRSQRKNRTWTLLPYPSALEREVGNPLQSPPPRRSQNIHNLYYG